MKIQELLEGASAVLMKTKSAKGEKTGTLKGTVDDWIGEMNKRMKEPITKAHIEGARAAIKDSAEYKAMADYGFRDVSTAAAKKNGTFIFTDGPNQFNFLATGKVNDRSGYAGGTRGTTLPRIVPSDPNATLVKTMTRSLAHFTSKRKK